MNYPLPPRRPPKAFATTAFAAALLITALIAGSLPTSFARSQVRNTTQTNNFQQTPDLTFVGLYRQTNLVSDLPGVALVEDSKLVNPWGVALNSTSPFWVVNNKADLATIYKGGASGSAVVPNLAL